MSFFQFLVATTNSLSSEDKAVDFNASTHPFGHNCLGKLVKSRSSSGKWSKPYPTCTVNIGYAPEPCTGDLPGSPIDFYPVDLDSNQDQDKDLCSSL